MLAASIAFPSIGGAAFTALSPSRSLATRAKIRSYSSHVSASLANRLWSPSDLTTYAESPWVSWLERLAREQPSNPLVQFADESDSFLELLGRKGEESEAAVLAALRSQDGGHDLIDLSSVRGSPEERVAATAEALSQRPSIIYQAPLMGGGFFGVADFLVRIGSGD